MPASLVDAFLELNALIRQGYAANLANGVQQVLGRPPRSMREWATRRYRRAGKPRHHGLSHETIRSVRVTMNCFTLVER
jgi:hypothetical protein